MYGQCYQPTAWKVPDWTEVVQHVRTLSPCKVINSNFFAPQLLLIFRAMIAKSHYAEAPRYPLYLAADDMTVPTVVLLCIPGSSGKQSLQGTVRPFGPGHRGNRR